MIVIEELIPIATSSDTELILGGSQNWTGLTVYRQCASDWNKKSSVAWQWQPTEELGFDSDFITYYMSSVSDAKLRNSEHYGGYVVATCSGESFCIIDYATGENLFSRVYTGENLHSIELLPDGNVVVAGSAGNSISIYAASQGNTNVYSKKYTFTDAHGLTWDPYRKVLWALGGNELTAYKVTGTLAEPTLEQLPDMTKELPSADGHDLFPVYGDKDSLWLSVGAGVYQYHISTQTFEEIQTVSTAGVKSIGNQPYSGNIVRTFEDSNNSYAVWCTDTIEILIGQPDGSYRNVQNKVEDMAFYKARVWHYQYW